MERPGWIIVSFVVICSLCILSQVHVVRCRPTDNETELTDDQSEELPRVRPNVVLRFKPENSQNVGKSVDSATAKDHDKKSVIEDSISFDGQHTSVLRNGEPSHSIKDNIGFRGNNFINAVLRSEPERSVESEHDFRSQTETDNASDITHNDNSLPHQNTLDHNEAEVQIKDEPDDVVSEEENEDELLPTADDCDVNNLQCTPFYGSPCNSLNKASGYYYPGRNCSKRTKPSWKQCGDGLHNGSACYCYKHAASCCSELSSIPTFNRTWNRTILYLNFTANRLERLDDITLQNMTQLKLLILNRNEISVITKDAFRDMKKLVQLELAYNAGQLEVDTINFTAAVNGLNETLRVLAVNFTQFSHVRAGELGITYIIRHLNLHFLRHLFVDGGRKQAFFLSDVHSLPNLCKLSITAHRLERLYCCSMRSYNESLDHYDDFLEPYDSNGLPYNGPYTSFSHTCVSKESRGSPFCQNFTLPNLEVLDLANNSLVYVPHFCNVNANTQCEHIVVPNLTHLSLSINAVVNPRRYHFKCLPSLASLALSGNPLKYLESNLFQELEKIHDADLRFTNVMKAEPFTFNHSTLTELTIKSSNWFVDNHHEPCCINSSLFNGSNLRYVDLSYNVFKYADYETVETVLSPMRSATRLLMAGIGLTRIPRIIREFTELEVFGFKSNLISNIPRGAFSDMPNLHYLDLSDNDLANVRVEILEELLKRKVHINLESNPFSCTCDMLPFLELYRVYKDPRPPGKHHRLPKNHTGVFVGSHYRCFAPRSRYNQSLNDLNDLTVQSCLLTLAQEILIYVVCILLIFFLLVYALLYKYRWQVRFWLYALHVRLATWNNPQSRHRARFNAFVSYCKEDSNFVLNEVLPAIERTRRLPLCIHERDFIPGKYISQNVLERMEESSHVLLVLSNAALQNDWCRFELFAAQRYGLVYRRIPVTTLVLESLRVELMDGHVVTLLQSTPGIEWPGTECSARAVEKFWNRLGRTLGANVRR